jgi:hypothetical protein
MPLKAFTSDKEQLEIMQKDPLFYDGDILSRSAFELLKMSAACRELVRTLTVSIVQYIHGHAAVTLRFWLDAFPVHSRQ